MATVAQVEDAQEKAKEKAAFEAAMRLEEQRLKQVDKMENVERRA